MLDAFLSRIRCFHRCDGKRNMPDDREPLFFRFINNGKVSVPRKPVVHLDEVCALLLERIHHLPAFRSGADRDRWSMSHYWRPIYDRATREDARPQKFSVRHLFTPKK